MPRLRLEDAARNHIVDSHADPFEIPLSDRSLAERYVDAEVALQLKLGILVTGLGTDPQELAVRFERSSGSEQHFLEGNAWLSDDDLWRRVRETEGCRCQEAVLVKSIECIEGRERMVYRIVRSRVWLDGCDLRDVIAAQALEHRSRITPPIGTVKSGREPMMLAASNPVHFSERADQVIESRAKLMEIVASDNAQTERRWIEVLRAEDVPSGIRIVLDDKLVSCSFPGEPFRVQKFEMLFGALESLATPVQRMTHSEGA